MSNHSIQSAEQLQELISLFLNQSALQNKAPLIAVIGPTASGKTALGIALAKSFKGEIISADSRQIYKEMDIGTAKPTSEERQQATHHLINLINPDESFTLADFQTLATRLIRQIGNQGKLPILVGGTGLYINVITQNYLLPSSQPDYTLRQYYESLAKNEGVLAVHQQLQKIDPDSAQRIHPNNLRYVIRAIEIALHTELPKANLKGESPYSTLYLMIDWPRPLLYERVEKRIDQQLAEGLIEETQKLLRKYSSTLPAMSSLGYKEIADFLEGRSTLEDAVKIFKKHTRNFAKRQLTWFRKFEHVYSIPGEKLKTVLSNLH